MAQELAELEDMQMQLLDGDWLRLKLQKEIFTLCPEATARLSALLSMAEDCTIANDRTGCVVITLFFLRQEGERQ